MPNQDVYMGFDMKGNPIVNVANPSSAQDAASKTYVDGRTPLTTRGDLLTRDATGFVRKAIGAVNTVLGSDGTDPVYTKVTANHVDFSVDVTTGNATTGHHGLLPKLSGDADEALLGDGTWGAINANLHAEPLVDYDGHVLLDGSGDPIMMLVEIV